MSVSPSVCLSVCRSAWKWDWLDLLFLCPAIDCLFSIWRVVEKKFKQTISNVVAGPGKKKVCCCCCYSCLLARAPLFRSPLSLSSHPRIIWWILRCHKIPKSWCETCMCAVGKFMEQIKNHFVVAVVVVVALVLFTLLTLVQHCQYSWPAQAPNRTCYTFTSNFMRIFTVQWLIYGNN